MKVGYYRVSDVGGSSLVENFVDKRKSSVQSVRLDNGRINIDGVILGGEVAISADYQDVALEIESEQSYNHVIDGVECVYKKEIWINLKFKVDNYTMRIKEIPVKMTLDEIEKKLGHKVEVINK